MAGRSKAPSATPEPVARYFDDEERELVESFEAALDRGDVRPDTRAEHARGAAEWRAIAEASMGRETVSVSLPAGDLERIKAAARDRGVSFEALMGKILHDFAQSVVGRR
jgi:hypothetical protein